ncbi:MAG: hypothetical protein CMP58_03605 [Flavobacteriales bacterium]|nr:hypothetical protein [Flavobacteriales bacterium]
MLPDAEVSRAVGGLGGGVLVARDCKLVTPWRHGGERREKERVAGTRRRFTIRFEKVQKPPFGLCLEFVLNLGRKNLGRNLGQATATAKFPGGGVSCTVFVFVFGFERRHLLYCNFCV